MGYVKRANQGSRVNCWEHGMKQFALDASFTLEKRFNSGGHVVVIVNDHYAPPFVEGRTWM
jgi:hypothetical protein